MYQIDDILRVCLRCGDDVIPNDKECFGPDGGEHETISDRVNADAGDAPGSPYGTRPSSWMPVAETFAAVMANETAEWTPEGVDGCISMVVNGHDDVESILRDRESEYDYDADDILS